MRRDRLRKPSTKVYIIRPAKIISKNVTVNKSFPKVITKTVDNKTTGGCGCRRKK